jgi:hypothetical protein
MGRSRGARLEDVPFDRRARASERRRMGQPCGKKVWTSAREVRLAHSHAGYRIRPYYCWPCRGWHATGSEKR